MRGTHSHHRKDHGPSLLASKGLLAIVKVGKVEIGRHHFDATAVRDLYTDSDGRLHMTVDLDEPLIFMAPEGVEQEDWSLEMWSGDAWASLYTFSFRTPAANGLQVPGPLTFTVEPLKAKLLLRTYRDTDGSDAPPFRYDDDGS